MENIEAWKSAMRACGRSNYECLRGGPTYIFKFEFVGASIVVDTQICAMSHDREEYADRAVEIRYQSHAGAPKQVVGTVRRKIGRPDPHWFARVMSRLLAAEVLMETQIGLIATFEAIEETL